MPNFGPDWGLQDSPADSGDGASRSKTELKPGALQDAIFNSANFSSIATDAKGVIQIFNVGAERMLGYTAAEVMNKITPADISDPQEVVERAKTLSTELGTDITPGFEALVFKASRGIEDIYELTYIRKDGTRFPAVVSVTSLRDSVGEIIGYLLIGTDNTVRKQIEAARDSERDRFEQTLQEKNVELAHASRMKSEFLATMSHELRTPLNAIIGFSEALKDGMVGEMNGNQGEYVADIFSSGQHLLSLINDILDLSKIEAGMMALELESVDLNNLLANSLSIVRERAARQRIRLDLDIEGGLHSLQLDMRKTKQVIYNLLSNAVKFSAHGGRVLVSARRVSRATVGTLAGAWPQHNFPLLDKGYQEFVEICVSDEGIGIPAASLSKLFQSFTQIDSSLARRFEGTGLGLAMVRQLVELHGGTVAVASSEGEGTCVVAWLPLVESQLPVGVRPASVGVASPMERFAMIVEEDDKGADLIRLMLEAEGFTVLVAGSAEAALLLADGQSLSLITLALHLPDMDGMQLLNKLRETPALAKVPVVVIANGMQARAALEGGAAVLLQKPISRAQLKASLAMLGLHSAQEHSYSVLLVDDDPRALEVIASSLPSPAYSLLRALGGREAIDLARLHRPDLILLDLMMPEVNGFDVVDALQVDEDTASIPILVVTAKQITLADQQLLAKYPDKIIRIVEKAGFNRVGFISEVRRALTRH
jgi:signal transduction histidine kinase/CheY-like chemotaxis protein